MALSGVRSSWLIIARNCVLAWFAASASSRALTTSLARWISKATSRLQFIALSLNLGQVRIRLGRGSEINLQLRQFRTLFLHPQAEHNRNRANESQSKPRQCRPTRWRNSAISSYGCLGRTRERHRGG